MNKFTESYWTSLYKNNEAAWDAGAITTPLKEYIDQLKNKDLKILIPGAGNGHEAEYLFSKGFRNVVVLDISAAPIANLKKRIPDFPQQQLILGDFFKHSETYDLIIEQTFLCALDPALNKLYAPKMQQLLRPGGKLIGVLFTEPLHSTVPPFALSKSDYLKLFQPYFNILTLETCYNSIKPRAGRELFMILQKP